jgi:hypothetical protein
MWAAVECPRGNQSESVVREIRMLRSMCGGRKRIALATPRLSSTLLVRDDRDCCAILRILSVTYGACE